MDGTLGEIRIFAGNFAPRSWAACNGQLMAIAQNQALFSLLGVSYGGDGRSTFGIPDLRGRSAMGTGQAPGLTNKTLGQLGGTNAVTMQSANMPAHTHTATFAGSGGSTGITAAFRASGAAGTESKAGQNGASTLGGASITDYSRTVCAVNSYVADAAPTVPLSGVSVKQTAGSGTGTVANLNAGASQSFSIVQPYLGINFVICTSGIFPSRN